MYKKSPSYRTEIKMPPIFGKLKRKKLIAHIANKIIFLKISLKSGDKSLTKTNRIKPSEVKITKKLGKQWKPLSIGSGSNTRVSFFFVGPAIKAQCLLAALIAHFSRLITSNW